MDVATTQMGWKKKENGEENFQKHDHMHSQTKSQDLEKFIFHPTASFFLK